MGKGGDGEDWNRDRHMVNDACMQNGGGSHLHIFGGTLRGVTGT